MAARRQRFKFEIPNPHALHSFHGMAGLKQTVAQFVAARIGKRHFIPRRVLCLESLNFCASGAREFVDFGKRKQRFQFHQICLWEGVRLHDSICQVAIVRQKHKSGGVVFQAAHGKHALRNAIQQIAKRAPSFGIAHRRNNFRRLVQQQINAFVFRAKQLAGNFDVVARVVRFCAEFGDHAPVYSDVTRGDKLLRMPPRSHTSTRNNFLQSFKHKVLGFLVSLLQGLLDLLFYPLQLSGNRAGRRMPRLSAEAKSHRPRVHRHIIAGEW